MKLTDVEYTIITESFDDYIMKIKAENRSRQGLLNKNPTLKSEDLVRSKIERGKKRIEQTEELMRRIEKECM